ERAATGGPQRGSVAAPPSLLRACLAGRLVRGPALLESPTVVSLTGVARRTNRVAGHSPWHVPCCRLRHVHAPRPRLGGDNLSSSPRQLARWPSLRAGPEVPGESPSLRRPFRPGGCARRHQRTHRNTRL